MFIEDITFLKGQQHTRTLIYSLLWAAPRITVFNYRLLITNNDQTQKIFAHFSLGSACMITAKLLAGFLPHLFQFYVVFVEA